MSNKNLLYLALAAGAGYYVGHYLVKPEGAAMGLSNNLSAHDGARALGAYRAMVAHQNLKKPTYALYKKYGVQIEGNAEDGYALSPASRAERLLYGGGAGVKIGVATNLAD